MNPADPPNLTRHDPAWADMTHPDLTSLTQNPTGSDQI